MIKLFVMFLATLGVFAYAHEMTPTYPRLSPSHVDNVYKTTMEIFNRREEVEFYEIGVFDSNFDPIPFVSAYKVFNIDYLERMTFDVYIRSSDVGRATYICSRSKLRRDDEVRTAISSRICSKFK